MIVPRDTIKAMHPTFNNRKIVEHCNNGWEKKEQGLLLWCVIY